MSVTFTPDIIHSYDRLKEFLAGKQTDEKVFQQLLANIRPAPWYPLPDFLLETLSIYQAIFLKAVGCLLYYTGYVQSGLYYDLRAHTILNQAFDWRRPFGDDTLALARNLYSEECAPLWALPRMKKEEIRDERLKKLLFNDVFKFDEKCGMCRGEVLWFIRSYLKTKAFFQNHRLHFEALGHLFRTGAPIEAALVQQLGVENEVLQLHQELGPYLKNPLPDDQPLSQEKRAEIIATLKNLPPGAYELGVPHHALAYISLGNAAGVFFDPNDGTAFIHDDRGFEMIADSIARYQKFRKEGVDLYESEGAKRHAREQLVDVWKVELL